MFISVSDLERHKVPFDCAYPPGTLPLLEGDWKLVGGLRASGEAELLDQHGSRTIRVRGRIEGKAQGRCARCLDPVSKKLDGELDLFYYPMSVIARSEEISIHREQTEVGFYEGDGLELDAVVREQILLWLPMRVLCEQSCPGICPRCGASRDAGPCGCRETFTDPRWDALKNLKLKVQ